MLKTNSMDKIQKINRDYYDKSAKQWASVKTDPFFWEKEFRLFIAALKPRAKVLDIGCGPGRDAPLFLGIGRRHRFEGFDISRQFLKIAQARFPQLPFQYGNLLEPHTLPKKKYDAFWAASVLQHIPKENWSEMLNNIEHMMRAGGIGFFNLPVDRPNLASAEDPRYFSIFAHDEIKKLLSERGWKVLKTGKSPASRGSTAWSWYICRLSKTQSNDVRPM